MKLGVVRDVLILFGGEQFVVSYNEDPEEILFVGGIHAYLGMGMLSEFLVC